MSTVVTTKQALEALDAAIKAKLSEVYALEATRPALSQAHREALIGPVDHLGRTLR